jgi:TonB family protein
VSITRPRIDTKNNGRYDFVIVRFILKLALVSLAVLYAWSQAADPVLQPLVGQEFILIHAGEQARVKLKKSQLSRIKGSCDRAVLVEGAQWKAGIIRLQMQSVGTPSILGQRQGQCLLAQDSIVLELSGLAPDEPASSLLSSVQQVLQTPEEYLASHGIRFSLPPGSEDEIPVKPPPPITYPKVLLSVDGTYTPAARSARRKGAVQLGLTVGTDGRVHQAHVLRGLGFGLDEKATKVLPLWRFEPARQDNKPIAVASTIAMYFDIM